MISSVNSDISIWGSVGTGSLLEPGSSGHSRNCSFWHFSLGFIFKPGECHLGNIQWITFSACVIGFHST